MKKIDLAQYENERSALAAVARAMQDQTARWDDFFFGLASTSDFHGWFQNRSDDMRCIFLGETFAIAVNSLLNEEGER